MSGTTAATKPTQLHRRAPGGPMEVTVTDEGRKTDKLLDSHMRQVLPPLGFLPRSTEPVYHSQLGVWWTMGCDCDDARISDAHVLPLDMPVVL